MKYYAIIIKTREASEMVPQLALIDQQFIVEDEAVVDDWLAFYKTKNGFYTYTKVSFDA